MNVPLVDAARLVGASVRADSRCDDGETDPIEGQLTDGFEHLFLLFPVLVEWETFLRRLNLSAGDAAYLAALAADNRTSIQAELLASGIVSERGFCRALADELDIGHQESLDPDSLIAPDIVAISFLRSGSWRVPFRVVDRDGAVSYLLAPDRLGLSQLRALVEKHPQLRGRLRVVAPSILRAALIARARQTLVLRATHGLFDAFSRMSARVVLTGWQGPALGAFLVATIVAFGLWPGEAWLGLHFFLSTFFLSCVLLRVIALVGDGPDRDAPDESEDEVDKPVYSLLVALYREAEVVGELVTSLERIEWPRSRLDIKLVCEADDRETLGALRSMSLPIYMEIVEVPAFGPRTKPKALAFALPLARGDFVALYDAEDHPHPQQLLQAWRKFRQSPQEVACIQAPLEIVNGGSGMITRMFAFEYAILFRGMLPFLAGHRLLVPLGGTSNHFRRAVIDEVGNWDPFNVTEDADLGMRLTRMGYRTEMIYCPTWETAPEKLSTWLPQRTRWLKGWMQTWLVHMRHPALLFRELGPASFMVCQVLFAGMVMSALAHPFFLLTGLALAAEFVFDRPASSWRSALLAIDIVNIGFGYLSFLLLGWKVSRLREKVAFWKVVLFTPVYWMFLSFAAWRALWQLCRKPHLWEKTPHLPLGENKRNALHRSGTPTRSAKVLQTIRVRDDSVRYARRAKIDWRG